MENPGSSSDLRAGWRWVPTAFFAEGAPFMTVSAVTAILFKSMGMDNTRMAFWTGLMMLPWSIKPLWSPLLDLFGTKRRWIILCQFVMAALFGAGALLLGMGGETTLLIGVFFLLAFASATHDVAADGFYLIALDAHAQSFFSGIRSTFYRVATVSVQGGLVALAGFREMRTGSIAQGWGLSLLVTAAAMLILGLWHTAALPKVERPAAKNTDWIAFFRVFRESWQSFLRLPGIKALLFFLFFFRIAEAPLGKIAGVFLIDGKAAGGMALPLAFQGFLYGTVGVLALTVGGILGGMAVSKFGFTRCAWPFALALNVPDLVYVYLAFARPESHWLVGICVAVEQFGYGLGYTAFMMVMIAAAANSGAFRTSHFAFMTAVSMLSLTLFSMAAGYGQNCLGYPGFFLAVVLLTLISFAALAAVLPHIPIGFGKKA